MSAAATGVSFDIVVALEKFRQGLRQQETEAIASANKIREQTQAAARQPDPRPPVQSRAPAPVLTPATATGAAGGNVQAATRAAEQAGRQASAARVAADENRRQATAQADSAAASATAANALKSQTDELGKQRTLSDSVLGATIKLGVAIKAGQGAVAAWSAISETLKAQQAAIAGSAEQAAGHYIKAAEAIASIPIVGPLAEAISGGATAEAKQALADAAARDAETKRITKERADAKERGEFQARSDAATTMPTDAAAVAQERVRHEQARAAVAEALKEKKIGQETADKMNDAEQDRYRAAVKRLEIGRQESREAILAETQQAQMEGKAAEAATEREMRERKEAADTIAFEAGLRRAQEEADKKGQAESGAVREANDEKRKARESALAREKKERDRAEAQAAADVVFAAGQRDLRTGHKEATADLAQIEHDAANARAEAERQGASAEAKSAIDKDEASRLRALIADLKKPQQAVAVGGSDALRGGFGGGVTVMENQLAVAEQALAVLSQLEKNTRDNTATAG